jgi:hypothetical protein
MVFVAAQDQSGNRVAFGLAPSLALSLRTPVAPKSASGRFVFGYFLLAKQKKVSRVGPTNRQDSRLAPLGDPKGQGIGICRVKTHIQSNRRVSDSRSTRLARITRPFIPAAPLPIHQREIIRGNPYCPLTRIPPASSMRSPAACSTLTISVRYSRRWRVIRKLSRTNCRAF